MTTPIYQPRRRPTSRFVPVRGLQYHVRTWGTPRPAEPPLVLAHGWMDMSASWQFVVDALERERFVVAADWRGFGRTQVPPVDSFWFPDYLADLDALLDHFAGDAAVDLVGHSMGANVAMQYAGVRPERVRRLVNLEGFGLPATQPDDAPARFRQWMAEARLARDGRLALQTYDDADGVARRLRKTNPRLGEGQAAWLAREWAQPDADGRWAIQGDAAHKVASAQLFRLDETRALYRAITAPVLAVEAGDDSMAGWWKDRYTLADYHERLRSVADCRVAVVADAGHMLHHDQPLAVARLIEQFVAS